MEQINLYSLKLTAVTFNKSTLVCPYNANSYQKNNLTNLQKIWQAVYFKDVCDFHCASAGLADHRGEGTAGRQNRSEIRTEQNRAEQSRAEQDMTGQDRTGQDRAEQSRAEQSRAEQSRAEQSRAEQSRAEQSRAEQSRAEQNRTEQNRTEQNRTEQNSCFVKYKLSMSCLFLSDMFAAVKFVLTINYLCSHAYIYHT